MTLLSCFFLFANSAHAQILPTDLKSYYAQYRCLFEPRSGGVSGTNDICTHISSEVDVKAGVKSGIAANGVPATSTDPSGWKSINIIAALTMDKTKIGTDQDKGDEYFWDRTEDRDDAFIVRVGYTDPATNEIIYKLTDIKSVYENYNFPAPQTVKGFLFYNQNPSNGNDDIVDEQKYEGVAELPTIVPFGGVVTVDLWYCAEERDDGAGTPELSAETTAPSDRVEYFVKKGESYKYDGPNSTYITATSAKNYTETKCKGTAYFKIGETATVTLPQKGTVATTQSTGTTVVSSSNQNNVTGVPECGITSGELFVGCIGFAAYYLVYFPIQWVAGIFGRAFDFFLGYSISDESYRAPVILTGWKLVRDISNIFFIIILVWTGLSTVFNFSKVSMKSVVPTLIINALIINFSLFGTQVLIDISNITARLFYNTMSVCDGKCEYGDDGKINNLNTETTGGYKPLSTKIVAAFNPQRIMKPEILSPNVGNQVAGQTPQTLSTLDYNGYFIVVTLIAALIMFAIAKMLFSVMFIFVGRVIGLYMTMIFSPFAVLTRGNMPIVGKIEMLAWPYWLKELTTYATLAPIFVFFLYIIYAFINTDLITSLKLNPNGGFMETVLGIAIPMFLVYSLIGYGVKIAKKYSGVMGDLAQSFGVKATGFLGGAGLGIASGAAAFAGTRVAGLTKLKEETRAKLAERQSRGGFAGRLAGMQLKLSDSAQNGSFEFRKTGLYKRLNTGAKSMGLSLNDRVSGSLGLNEDRTKGGIKEVEKKEREALKKKIESISTNMKDGDAKTFWEKKAADLAKKEEERLKKDEAALSAAYLAANKTKTQADVDAMKAANTLKDQAAILAKKKIDEDYGKVENNKQLTQALRIQFAETIANSKTFGQQASPYLGGAGVGAGARGIGAAFGAGGLAGALPVAGALGAVGYDRARQSALKKDEARNYAKKAREDMKNNKVPKEERLEAEKKKLEEKLTEMDRYTTDINDELVKHFETIITQANNGSQRFKQFKDRTLDSFKSKPEDLAAAVEIHRQSLRDENEDITNEIKQLKNDHAAAQRRGDTAESTRLKDLLTERKIKKGDNEYSLQQLDERTRITTEDNLSKKEAELDKIKEKKEADKKKNENK